MKSPMGMSLGEEYIVKYLEKSSLFQFFLFSRTSQIGTTSQIIIAPDMSSPFTLNYLCDLK